MADITISDLSFKFEIRDFVLNNLCGYEEDYNFTLILTFEGKATANITDDSVYIYPEIEYVRVDVDDEVAFWELFDVIDDIEEGNPKHEKYREQLTKDVEKAKELVNNIISSCIHTDLDSLSMDNFFNTDYISYEDVRKLFEITKKISDTINKLFEEEE